MNNHKPNMHRLPLLLFLVACLAGCATDSREPLVIYSPHGPEQLQDYEDRFEAAYPEVDLQWIDMGGQDAYDRIRTEQRNPQASVWWGGAAPAFSRAAKEGLLEPYTPSWAEHAAPNTYDPAHHWYGTYLTPEVIAYNTDNLDSTTAPRDWDDLLDPTWADRIIIRYPLASSTMRTIFGAMIMRQPTVEEGYRWLARLDQNTKAYTPDPTYMYLRLGRGEADLSLWNMTDIYIQGATYPFGYLLPASGTPVLSDGIAIVKNAPNPERARQFYEFVTSDSALVHQAHEFYRIPTRQDIPQDQLPEWIARANIQAMDIDWERLEAEGPTWMQYWDENIKGRGAEYLAEQQ